MAPLPTVPNVMRVGFTWSDGVGTFGSRIYIGYGIGGNSADAMGDVLSEIVSSYTTNLASLIAPAYVLTKMDARDLASSTGLEVTQIVDVPGSNSGAELSGNVTMDLQLKIASHYRGGHPVTHFPPPPAGNLASPRQWQSAFTTLWNTRGAAFLSDVNAIAPEGGPNVVWMALRGYRPGALPEEVTPWPIQSVQARTYVGTMRRRARSLR